MMVVFPLVAAEVVSWGVYMRGPRGSEHLLTARDELSDAEKLGETLERICCSPQWSFFVKPCVTRGHYGGVAA